MRKTLVSIALASALPTAALAQQAAPAAPASPHTFTGNVGLFSQYIFRGLTQTNGKPALQGGFDYAHSSGFYIGTWALNVSWFEETNVGTIAAPIKLGFPGAAGAPFVANRSNSNNLEIDVYGGWKKSWGDWGMDIGLLQYYYPGTYENLANLVSKPNTLEGYVAGSWKWLSLKYSHSFTDAFGVKNSKNSTYLDLSAAIPLGDSGFTLALHAGKQTFKGTSPIWAFGFPGGNSPSNGIQSYTDYKIGLTKDWMGMTWHAFWTDTNAKAKTTAGVPAAQGVVWDNVYGKNVGKNTFTVGMQKTF